MKITHKSHFMTKDSKKRKLYIFLTNLIRGIGGGHIYTLNKIHFLENRGYESLFIHADAKQGDIVIKELLKYENNYDKALNLPCYMFDEKKQKNVLNHLLSMIPPGYDEYIIESQTVTCSTWGELLASSLPKGKNFVYLLGEHIQIDNEKMFGFYKFKLDRKELAGIGVKSLRVLFKGRYDIKNEECYHLTAYSTNVLAKIPYERQWPPCDYTIAYTGRIDKMFVKKSLCRVIDFVRNYSEYNFTILFIGGSTNPADEKSIYRALKGIPNVIVHITGIIYPIPVELIMYGDIFLATAGSCKASQELGKVTISYDVHDGEAIGLFGITTQNRLFRNADEPPLDTYSLLESVLIKKEYENKEADIDKILSKYDFDYSSHIDFVNSSSREKIYYDITSADLSLKQKILKNMIHIFGQNIVDSILSKILPLWICIKKIKNRQLY